MSSISPYSYNSKIALEDILTHVDIDLFPEQVRKLLDVVDRKFIALSELELRKKVRQQVGEDGEKMRSLQRLRLQFWNEYERAVFTEEKMNWERACLKTGGMKFCNLAMETIPALVPWIICPLEGYLLHRKEKEMLLEERVYEIISTSAIDEKGHKNAPWAQCHIQLYEMLQNRIYGPIVQKIESQQKNLNVNVNESLESARELTHEQIEEQLKLIQEKREALKNPRTAHTVDTQKLITGKS